MSTPENASPLELIASDIEAETAAGAEAAPGATGEAGQGAAPGQDQPVMTNAEIITGALVGGRDVFCLYTKLQSPKHTAPDPALFDLGQKWGAVADKRGLNLSKYLGDNMLELAAALATLALARSVYAGVQAEIAVLNSQTRPTPDAQHGDSTDPARAE